VTDVRSQRDVPTTPRGTRREAQKESTRRLLLDAAYQLFEAVGYEQTTMRAVAGRAGVALGTIFLHFPDKQALLVSAFETDLGRVIEEAIATLPRRGLRGQLLHVAGRLYAFYGARPRLARVLLQHGVFAGGEEGARLGVQVEAFLAEIAKVFEAAAEAGEVRPDVAPLDGAIAFWADYFTVLVGGVREGELVTRASLATLERLLDLRLTGLAPRDRSSRRGR
jgi:AcrR family transcriptional regulator